MYGVDEPLAVIYSDNVNAGTVAIIRSAAAMAPWRAQNYRFAFVDGTLTITPRDALARYIGDTTWVSSGANSTAAHRYRECRGHARHGSVRRGVLSDPGADERQLRRRRTVDRRADDNPAGQACGQRHDHRAGTFAALASAAGTYAGNDDAAFSVGMKYTKKGASVQGQITLAVPQADGVIYVKSNSISSMTMKAGTPKTATIYTKASIYKVQGGGTVITLDGNVTLN